MSTNTRSFTALLTLSVCVALAHPATAQETAFEIAGIVGYTFSEGAEFAPFTTPSGRTYNKIGPKSSISYGATADYIFGWQSAVGFRWSQQASKVNLDQVTGPNVDVTDVKVNCYHAIFTYYVAQPGRGVVPFVYGGLGATQYSPSDFVIPSTGRPVTPSGETQFSTTWGAGANIYTGGKFAFKGSANWTPTYIKSSPGGTWCDPYWGCTTAADLDYSHQFELAVGLIFRP